MFTHVTVGANDVEASHKQKKKQEPEMIVTNRPMGLKKGVNN